MTATESPHQHAEPEPAPAPEEPDDPEEPQEPAPAAPEAPYAGDDFASTADRSGHSLPPHVIASYYRVSDSDFSGPTVFGSGGVAVGVNLTADSAHRSERFVTGAFPPRQVQEALATYAPTPSDQELARQVSQRLVVQLHGAAGSGLPSTAMVALARRHDGRVARMILLQGLDRLINDPGLLLDRHGHILDTGADAQPQPHLLEILEARAHRQEATVVILTRSESRDNAPATGLRLRHTGPDHTDVFARWLRHLLRQQGRCVGRCSECDRSCQHPYVGRLLAEAAVADRLRGMDEVAEAVALAEHCARETPRPGADLRVPEDIAGLRRRASRALAVDRDAVGGKRTAHHLQAFRIAYALLSGVSITHVFTAVGRLVTELDRAQSRRPFGRPVLERDINALLGPELLPDPDEGEPVSGTARRARLRNPLLPAAILDVVWNDYDSLRQPLLTWIGWLGHHPHESVRQYVAAAAGRLCGHDFDEVRDRILDGWAGARPPRVRRTAAMALESAAFDRRLWPRVLRYVRELVHDRSEYRRDVAMRFYATRFGATFHPYALDDLAVLARDPVYERNDLVAQVVAGLYAPETGSDVLATVCRWADAEEPGLRAHADRCLVLLARLVDDSADARPYLLSETGLPHDDLARLWRSALLRPWTSADAWEVLEGWLTGSGGRPDMAGALTALVSHLLDDPLLCRRFTFYMRHKWQHLIPEHPLLDELDALVHPRRRPT